MDLHPSLLILPAAFILDFFLGDPAGLPHPIKWMGSAITRLEPYFRQIPVSLTLSGALFAFFLIALSWGVTWLIVAAARDIHPIFGYLTEIILIYYTIASISLETAAISTGTLARFCSS